MNTLIYVGIGARATPSSVRADMTVMAGSIKALGPKCGPLGPYNRCSTWKPSAAGVGERWP